MILWGAKRNSPTTRDSFPRFNVTGPDDPLSGNITRICVLVHSRIGAGTPLKSTASWPGFLWPNPRPEITTGLPIGPSVGSRVIGIITVKVTGAVVLYCTGAQQDPSGKGSMEATLTTSGPVIAFDGTFTSIRVSRHCTTSAATPLNCTSLTPKGINVRSEEHTSELQSPCNLVCRLLLEKKKIIYRANTTAESQYHRSLRLHI